MPIGVPQIRELEEILQRTPKTKSFVFSVPEIAKEAKPGQFLMVWSPKVDEIPIAIAHCDLETGRVEIAVSDEGECSHSLHQKNPGDLVGLRGPYGRAFSFRGDEICMVAGGYGVASLWFAAEVAKKGGKNVLALIGAKSRSHLLYLDELKKIGCQVRVATEDGSEGSKGFVTDLLLEEIENRRIDQVLTCGPELMIKRVCEITKNRVPTEVSIERHMKCAMGICGACDCGGYLVCKDGPVFNAENIFEKTEFARWKRDKTGARIPFPGYDISSVPSPIFTPRADRFLKTNVCGIEFPNPIMNASGTSVSGKHLYRLAVNGAGGMVTKSTCLERRTGYNNPTVIEIAPLVYQNGVGLSNQGIQEFELEIKDAKRAQVPLITSVFGQTEPFDKEFAKVGSYMKKHGSDMIELNISCPHTRVSICEQNPDLVKEIVRAVKEEVDSTPTFVKLSPNANYIELAKAAVEAGADGITAINTLKFTYLNKALNIPVLSTPDGTGGKSGKEHGPLGKKIVFEIREEVDVPIAASGGIFSGRDVIDYAMNGASLFQICSAFATQGTEIFGRITKEVTDYLAANKYENLSELVGIAHKR